MNPVVVPTANPNLRAGDRTDAWFGLNLYIPDGELEGQRMHFGLGLPVHQHLDGPQLRTNLMFQTGWSWTW